MSQNIDAAISQFVDTVASMNKAWAKAGGIAPALDHLDNNLSAMDLLVTMAKNGIRFTNID